MGAQGLDRATAPDAAKAKQMLDSIGGRWWNVYIGGPESGGHGWTPAVVREYVKHGIDRFMLTYVGRQHNGPLTRPQGRADGLEAVRIAKAFGYSGNVPICLDVELHTYESAPAKAVEYTKSWCETVRDAGARPGVYANPTPLKAMAQAKVPAEFVWCASWVNHGPTPHDPHAIPNLPSDLWGKQGARAWQYAGAFGNQPCRVGGLDVDINVADLGCLAKAPGRQVGTVGGPRLLRRGDAGKPVERLTKRLARARSRRTGAPYLEGGRRRLDARAESALKAFQREHGLDDDGVYGPATARALVRALKLQRRPGDDDVRDDVNDDVKDKKNGKKHVSKPRLRVLIEDVRRLEAETDRAWQRLVSYGEDRRRLADRIGDGPKGDPSLAQIAAILRRMEETLEALVEVERRELELRQQPAPPAAAPAPPVAEPAHDGEPEATAPAAAGATAAVATTTAPEGPNGAGATLVPPPPPPPDEPLRLTDLDDEELEKRVERLDRALTRSRLVLMRRYLEAEKKIAVLAPERRVPKQTDKKREEPREKERKEKKDRKETKEPVRGVAHVRDLQSALNKFTGEYLQGVGPLLVDGKKGPETNKRIRRVKYYLGYKGRDQKVVSADPDFLRRMEHPRSPRASNPAMVARGIKRRRKQAKVAKAAAAPRAGVANYDGKQVAAWLVPHLEWARANGWKGTVISGYRTPEYSEHVCRGICGAPSCPGRCAGRSSNHSGRVAPRGAVDVSDCFTFAALMKRCPHQPRIFNNLPNDRPHFSATGG
jgi:hypothetical protein